MLQHVYTLYYVFNIIITHGTMQRTIFVHACKFNIMLLLMRAILELTHKYSPTTSVVPHMNLVFHFSVISVLPDLVSKRSWEITCWHSALLFFAHFEIVYTCTIVYINWANSKILGDKYTQSEPHPVVPSASENFFSLYSIKLQAQRLEYFVSQVTTGPNIEWRALKK